MQSTTLVTLSKSHLFWSAPLALAGLVVLCLTIARLVRTVAREPLAKVPLQARSLVELPDAGDVLLHLEGPRLTRAFAGLRCEVVRAEGGAPVALSRALIPMQTAGLDTVRAVYGTVHVPAPGRYELRVDGLDSARDVARCALVFTRPQTLGVVLCILGIVFSGLMFVGGTIFSLIVALGGTVSRTL